MEVIAAGLLRTCAGGIRSMNRASSRLQTLSSQFTTQQRRMASSKIKMADRMAGTDKNVWVTFTELARITGAVNMGQGFPDYPPPAHVYGSLHDISVEELHQFNQYTRGFGHPRLVNAIAKMYGPFHNRELDPMKEVLVTGGAYEALFCSFQGLCNPGDEVVIIEPFFDCYKPMAMVSGAKPVFCPLRPTKDKDLTSADWKLNMEEFASKFNEKTKLLILNNPNNPLGKLFSRDELAQIAELCIKHDVVCIADEVYEWMVFPGSEHVRIANLPGMWDRTVTISSAGKTFSATGWKLGWAIAPEHLMKCLMTVHQNCLYTCCTPIQESVARAFEVEIERVGDKKTSYLSTLANDELLPKRDRIVERLREAGMEPTVPQGGYFIIADWSKMNVDPSEYDDGSDDPQDFKFVKWLTKEKKLATIPPSAFYSDEHRHLAKDLIRFCFFKKDETLDAAGKILRSFK